MAGAPRPRHAHATPPRRHAATPPRRHAITPSLPQVVGFIVLVLGVYVLTATKDSRPGCAAGMQAVLGGCNTPEYKAVAVSDIEVVPICDMGNATRS